GELVLHALELARIEAVALGRARLATRLLERGAELVLVDLLALPQHRHRPPCRRGLPPLGRRLDLGRERLVLLEQVLLHAEEGERDAQQAEDHHGDPARGFVAEFLQHRSKSLDESGSVYPDWPHRASRRAG